MEIILSKRCESFTGSLGKGFGYHIQRRKNGFFAKRNSKGEIPANGHLRFIFFCAYLAQLNTHITDIRVPRCEFQSALSEAGVSLSGARDIPHESSATDVLTLKEKLNL
jgi:hypothetical protein